MSTRMKNVHVGKSAVDVRLASTGIHSCIAMVVCSEDGTTFIYHIDPSKFDVETQDPRKECIKLMKKTMQKFNRHKKNLSFDEIYIVGGLNNGSYSRLHNEFNLLATDHSAPIDRATEPISKDMQAFCQSIKYVNLSMNIGGEADNDEVSSATFITGITVVSDRTIVPPMLCMVQYFGTEGELHGGARHVQPWLVFMKVET